MRTGVAGPAPVAELYRICMCGGRLYHCRSAHIGCALALLGLFLLLGCNTYVWMDGVALYCYFTVVKI